MCKEKRKTERTYIYNLKQDEKQVDERGLLDDHWKLFGFKIGLKIMKTKN